MAASSGVRLRADCRGVVEGVGGTAGPPAGPAAAAPAGSGASSGATARPTHARQSHPRRHPRQHRRHGPQPIKAPGRDAATGTVRTTRRGRLTSTPSTEHAYTTVSAPQRNP